MTEEKNNLTAQMLEHITRRRPQVIYRDEQELETEVLDSNREVKEVDDKKYVIEIRTIQTTTRSVVVRLHDPETSYQDGLEEFVDNG